MRLQLLHELELTLQEDLYDGTLLLLYISFVQQYDMYHIYV